MIVADKANIVELHHIFLTTFKAVKKILNPKVKYTGTSYTLGRNFPKLTLSLMNIMMKVELPGC